MLERKQWTATLQFASIRNSGADGYSGLRVFHHIYFWKREPIPGRRGWAQMEMLWLCGGWEVRVNGEIICYETSLLHALI